MKNNKTETKSFHTLRELQTCIDGLLRNLNEFWHSHFTTCVTLETESEKDIKKEVHELLDKVTELVYNNQEVLNIKVDDFITLVKIKEEMK